MDMLKTPIMGSQDILNIDNKNALVSCTCQMYYHYMVCEHTYCLLWEQNIIKGIPVQFDSNKKRAATHP